MSKIGNKTRRSDYTRKMMSVIRRFTLIVLVGIVVAAPAAGGVGLASAQEASSPTINVGNATVGVGNTANVSVTMSAAPNGLAGYNIVLGVANDSVATITDATINEKFNLSEVNVSKNGSTMVVNLRAVDLEENIQEGATNISLADVEIKGQTAGETTLEVKEVRRIDNDNGTKINVNTNSGQITVEEADNDGGNVTINVSNATVGVGNTTNASVTMSAAPNGLSGYNIVLGVANDSVATITDATINEKFNLSEVNVSENGSTMVVNLRAVDLEGNIQDGATNISLADVEIKGQTAGETTLEVKEVRRIGNDNGAKINVNTNSGQITVEEADNDGGNATMNLDIALDRKHVTAGDKTKANVVLSKAPEGVAGFNITVSVNGEKVNIIAASAGDEFDLSIADSDTDTAMIRGVDINRKVEAGAENVTLAEVYVRAATDADGTVEINITDVEVLENDEAKSIPVSVSGATLEVHNVAPIVYDQTPTDINADGLYADIDGNGELTRNDTIVFLKHFNSEAIQGHDEYDFDGNGKVSYNDIVALSDQIAAAG
jgi:ribosome-associated translation inhibitor RaiA